jgi:hypothetical protein
MRLAVAEMRAACCGYNLVRCFCIANAWRACDDGYEGVTSEVDVDRGVMC